MSLSKRRSSSVGNKARLAASHQPASVSSSSTLALNVTSTVNSAQITAKVISTFKLNLVDWFSSVLPPRHETHTPL